MSLDKVCPDGSMQNAKQTILRKECWHLLAKLSQVMMRQYPHNFNTTHCSFILRVEDDQLEDRAYIYTTCTMHG